MATKKPSFHINAGMVELVDSGDLGSPAKSVRVRVPLPAPTEGCQSGYNGAASKAVDV